MYVYIYIYTYYVAKKITVECVNGVHKIVYLVEPFMTVRSFPDDTTGCFSRILIQTT